MLVWSQPFVHTVIVSAEAMVAMAAKTERTGNSGLVRFISGFRGELDDIRVVGAPWFARGKSGHCGVTAETITVCLDGSCDYTDIQEAIDASANFDVIEIAAGTYEPVKTIAISGVAITVRGAVDRDGNPTTIIDGQGAIRVLECAWLLSPEIENLVVTGGQASRGGGLYCHLGAKPTFRNCVFLENSASFYGGGIACLGNTTEYETSPTFEGCRLIGNTAFFGGGLDCEGPECSPIFTDCIFEMNSASERGGGLNCFDQSDPRLISCVFRENTAFGLGGGVFSEVSSMPILNDTILCGNSPSQIHGPFAEEGDNCIAFSCVDDDANGLPDKCDENGRGTLLVPSEYATVASAIAAAGDTDVIEIESGTYNSASTLNPQGKSITLRGAIDSAGIPTTVISGQGTHRVFQCTSGEQADTVFENLVITGGQATNGGGMFCEFSSPTLNNCVFRENASTYGGGLSCQESDPTLNDCVFRSNSALEGAGLRCFLSGPTLNRCLFEENVADFNGGAMLAHFGSRLELNDCVVEGNSAMLAGGGIYTSNKTSSSALADTRVCGNTPEQLYGAFTDQGGNCVRGSCGACQVSCTGDLDLDGQVNGEDLGLFLAEWGACAGCAADFNADGFVNGEDLGVFLVAWGPCS